MSAHPLVERIGWTLIRFVWQGSGVGLACAIVLSFVRVRARRHAVECAALAAMLIAPAVTFALFGSAGHGVSEVIARRADAATAQGVSEVRP